METPIAQKLKALEELQKIDSRLDDIFKIRGALPDEVADLEDEIAGFNTRIQKFENESQSFTQSIEDFKTGIKTAEDLILKYDEQSMNVRNNREYDAIVKEKELQELEIKVLQKRIKEFGFKIEKKNEDIQITNEKLQEREKDLQIKKEELKHIVEESQEEEEKLKANRTKAEEKIEERLRFSYNRIRENARNGLAVVFVERGACGGCFNIVPPQRRADIKEKKKLIVCEHCGRILADVIPEPEPEVKKPKRTRKTTTKKTAKKKS